MLSLDIGEHRAQRVWQGRLTCPQCQRIYPVVQGIPRFVSESGNIQDKIAHNFGDAWTLYAQDRVNPYTEEQFLDWIMPLTPADFEQRAVLDLGCGLAGFSEFAAQYPSSLLIGMDISHAVDSAVGLLDRYPHLNLIQGDILRPPFKKGVFDLVYSIGVLHHLDAPEAGFEQASRLVKPEGRLFCWVYGRENNTLVIYLVDPLRRLLSSFPVSWVRFGVALPMSLLLWALLQTVYHPRLNQWCRGLPYHTYFQWLRPYGWYYTWGMITDQLIPPRTHYLSKETLAAWAAALDLKILSLNARNGMSWRFLVQRK